jgi:hypothetical protein
VVFMVSAPDLLLSTRVTRGGESKVAECQVNIASFAC